MTDTISLNVETIAELPKITELVVFGDSLSDIGNIYQVTNQETPPSPPYFEGRFSNGPIWVDQLLPELGLTSNSLLNFAYGGAETGVNTVTQGIPGLTEQVALFEASLDSNPVDPNALYTILIGGNDLTNSASQNTIATAITNISTSITDLANLGAENIIVLNLPNLGLLPKNIDADTSTIATDLATAFNTELNSSLTTLETTLNLDLHLVDLFGLTTAIGANPNDYGFTQPTNDVLIDENPASIDPNNYVFWDELHPTTKTHGLITDTVITTMENEGILAVVGQTDVILNGVREDVRTQETNLGNLIADAHLTNAQAIDSTVDIALVNGGGIGSNINIGDITNFEVEAVSPFNNDLVLLTLTGTELEQIIEHSVAQYGNMDIGPFPQISGLSFSYDQDQQAIAFDETGAVVTDGERIQSLVVNDSDGKVIKLVENGDLVAENANTEFRVVTLSFLAEGGDDYPFDIFGDNLVTIELTEQISLTTYLQENHLDTPFNIADTAIENDERSQNLNFREDTVIATETTAEPISVFGGIGVDNLDAADPETGFSGNNTLTFTGSSNDLVDTSSATLGHNRIYAGSGDDSLVAGKGDRIFAGNGDDNITLSEGQGNNRVYGGNGNDTFTLGAGDRLFGGDGVDKFYVTTGGDNLITGGTEKDEFWIANAELPAPGNRITDFTKGEDVLGIGGDFGTQLDSFADLNIVANEGITTISMKETNDILVTLNGEFNLTANDFVFA